MAAYSFLDVTASISGPGGAFQIGGGGAGNLEEGISIEPVEDKNTMTLGAGGEGMHSLHAGKAATVTIRLLKTSDVNAQLSQMFNLQTSSAALHGQNTIVISNIASGDNITCEEAAFKKMTPISFGKDGGGNEWTFDVVRADVSLGGL